MKILAIRGCNLASLEGGFEVDFTVEPLLTAGIFAISGPTGAGKSTLLDAMCLALFARTPRTDQAKENNVHLRDVNEEALPQGDPRFLLRRGTAAGYAEVDFAGQDGHRYRSRWSVARAREKANGRLQPPKITLFDLSKTTEVQGTRGELLARVSELVGLTFEQFTRSVLLAQNDFSTFLKAEQGDKASLLEKLTGTEQYSVLSRLIFSKSAEAREAYEQVRVQMQGILLLSEEEEKELQEQLGVAETVLAHLEKQKMERQQLQDAVKTAEQHIAGRRLQQKEAAVKQEQACLLLVKAQNEYKAGLEQQQQSESYYHQTLQPELQQARKLDVQIETATGFLERSVRQLEESARSKKEAEDKLTQLETEEKRNKEETATLKAWLEKYRDKEGIASQLTALLLHLDAASAAQLAMGKSAQAIEANKKAVAALDAELKKQAVLIARGGDKQQQTEAALKQVEMALNAVDPIALEKETTACRAERERLLVEQAQFVATGDVKALRDKLSEGTPCPVCGSVAHPYTSHEANERLLSLAKSIAAITLRLGELSRQSETYTTNRKQQTALQHEQLTLHRQMTECENVRAELLNRKQLLEAQNAHEQTILTSQADALNNSFVAANGMFGNDSWQQRWKQDAAAFRKTLTGFAREWQEKSERLSRLEREQESWKATRESHQSFLPKLIAQWKEFGMIYQNHLDDLKKHRDERDRLLGGKPADETERAHTRRMDELKRDLQRLQMVQAEQSGVAEQYKGIAEQIAKDLAEAMATLQERTGALDSWTTRYSEQSGGVALEEVLALRTKERTDLLYRLRLQAENKQKIAGLKEEAERKEMVSNRWAKLNELAGSADGGKFRRIAQGYTLDVLLNYANVQLRLLSRRYRLERVPETLALQVIDQDMCDEVRSVHSLSGGESFLVSLALALGLSSLSSNRMKVESLFIDEGFGSLDAETLRMAMDALESLHTQGRKIGVISHVQEMTERIPVRIEVNRMGNGRSVLEIK